MVEVAVALRESETDGIGELERRNGQTLGIEQRAEYPFSGRGVDQEAVGVVNFGAEIVGRRALVLAEEEHAGKRGKPELRDVLAQVKPSVHVDLGGRTGAQDELVGAGRAGRVEQSVERERALVSTGPLDPELGEARKLLPGGECGVDCEPARGCTVDLALAERPEEARPRKTATSSL